MKIEKIKPIPQNMLALIKRTDKRFKPNPDGHVRYYAYLTKNDGELCKVTCAVKHHKGKWYCKQVAVHGLHSDRCFAKDMDFNYIAGYLVGWHAEGITPRARWYEGDWGHADDQYFDPYAHLVNPEYTHKFPTFKYAACDLYKGDNIMQYLRTYEKYPQAEYLVKLGLSFLTDSKQILQKIGKDKRFAKWIATNRAELEHCYISAIMNAHKQGKPIKEVQAYEASKKYLAKPQFAPIRAMLGGQYEEYVKYIAKQNINDTLYLDYLKACNFLGLDMTEDRNRYPHDFMRWHDIRIDEYHTAKALKDMEQKKELFDKFAEVAQKYLAMQGTSKYAFVAVIAKTPYELIKEGDALHHCVGRMGYDQKFVREQTLIFFIRSTANPEKPLATVEYSVKKREILQCYADHNSTPDQSVMDYVNNVWLPHANKAIKKIAA